MDMLTLYKGAPQGLWFPTSTEQAASLARPCPALTAPCPPARPGQMVSSIGGNASTNAGGPHCLKYGITVNHVLGLEVVTGAGEVVRLGGKVQERPGYDLTGVVVGSAGTLGILTQVTVRLPHTPDREGHPLKPH